MKSRIRGGDAARAAVATTERLPVTLQATDLVGPFQPMPEVIQHRKPPRVRKPSARHDVIHAPTTDLDTHRAILRTTFGTFSEEFADTMMGKVISGLRPNAYDLLEEATLKSAPVTGRRRCRMHGGADGSGAPRGSKNGNYKHGRYTEEVQATRQWLREATKLLRGFK